MVACCPKIQTYQPQGSNTMNDKASEEHLKNKEENLNQWQDVLRNIFPTGLPEKYGWSSFSRIVNTLNILAEGKQTCIIFTPSGGWMELGTAEPASEPGCIKISDEGSNIIIKPESLIFQSFPNQNLEWSYFRLETATLQPVSDHFTERFNEELTLLPNGEYDNSSVYVGFDSYEQPELIGCERVMRFTKGIFVIFVKFSIYSSYIDHKDSPHNTMNTDEFREFVSECINHVAKIDKM